MGHPFVVVGKFQQFQPKLLMMRALSVKIDSMIYVYIVIKFHVSPDFRSGCTQCALTATCTQWPLFYVENALADPCCTRWPLLHHSLTPVLRPGCPHSPLRSGGAFSRIYWCFVRNPTAASSRPSATRWDPQQTSVCPPIGGKYRAQEPYACSTNSDVNGTIALTYR